MNIAVAGLGYVGLANAVLLAQHHKVTGVDIVKDKAELINNGCSPIEDRELEEYLKKGNLDLKATTDGESAYKDAEYVIISTPTNYDPVKNYFDHTVYVVQCKTSNLCIVFADVLSKTCNACILLYVSARNHRCDHYCFCLIQIRWKQSRTCTFDRTSGI